MGIGWGLLKKVPFFLFFFLSALSWIGSTDCQCQSHATPVSDIWNLKLNFYSSFRAIPFSSQQDFAGIGRIVFFNCSSCFHREHLQGRNVG
jgi:hypothetical protein